MVGTQAEEILALALIFVVHVAGGLMLVWGMLDSDRRPDGWRRRWWRGDDGPQSPPPRDPPPPARSARTPLPLPGADASRVRLRDETLLRDGYERPPRRPRRAPARTPSRP